ncbi:MAG: flagellin [Halobacteriota archaeon]|uniref:flagellin n=1 Tax=Natronomonas sp. TaxID=2184060 RepID=UPI0039749EE1
MSSVSASHLVIFIVSIVVAAGVAGTLVTEVDRVSTSIADQSEGVEERIDTDIQIISDTGSPDAVYDAGANELTLYVKNTGRTELRPDPEAVDVLIEGSFTTPESVARADGSGSDRWPAGSVVEVTVTGVDISGETRVTVAVRDNEDAIRFRV